MKKTDKARQKAALRLSLIVLLITNAVCPPDRSDPPLEIRKIECLHMLIHLACIKLGYNQFCFFPRDKVHARTHKPYREHALYFLGNK